MRIFSVMAAALTACVVQSPDNGFDEPLPIGDGTVEVSWFVGSSGCEVAGVTEVRIELGTFDETFPCAEGGTSIALEAGDYTLVATGFDADGVARFEGREPIVSVFEGQETTLPTVRLEALPAELTVFWRFENGSLCGANGVDLVNVAVLTNEEFVAPFPIDTDCAPGEATYSGISAGVYQISLLGLNDQGQAQFTATQDVELLRGESAAFELVLVEITD